eukprot:NODE_1564_length_939_cov_495.875281_g1090_i0.p1 GENE.NODE_1564_length_939_cov_495.875281_g1090_i0~~NODE_1564_length_939_cov_495.875281_g1090_i0.p1  ORF type:complete len:126 (-),score=34.22 NODE_1564_length_939_cov_495.875281_g1090_i0:561-908(-)
MGGPPADATPGDSTTQIPIPPNTSIKGLYNGRGDRIRLTVKTPENEIWMSSNTSTQKLPFGQIEGVLHESIPDHKGYSLVTFTMGNHKVHLYYVPSQYVRNLKNYILGWDPTDTW